MKTGYVLDANEKIINRYSRHWIDLLPSAVSSAFLIIVATGLAYLYGRFTDQFPAVIPGFAVAGLIALMIILGLIIFLISLWVYRQNHLLLTNLHLVQVEQRGIFGRQVSQLSLARVQDVSGTRSGFIATVLNYGDVVVQSAGEQDKFIFHNAPDPSTIADRCLEAHEEFIRSNPDREF